MNNVVWIINTNNYDHAIATPAFWPRLYLRSGFRALPHTLIGSAWSRDSLITGIPVVGEHLWVQIFKKQEEEVL